MIKCGPHRFEFSRSREYILYNHMSTMVCRLMKRWFERVTQSLWCVMTSRSQAVLSYGDTVLYQDDLSLLQPGCWLNDNLIAFYLEFVIPLLSCLLCSKMRLSLSETNTFLAILAMKTKTRTFKWYTLRLWCCWPSLKVWLWSPWLYNFRFDPMTTEVSELREMVMEPLDLQNKKIILIPINNNSNATSVGGSHWSLLVFERLKEAVVFRHFDSFGGLNDSIAKKTAKKFASMLQLPFDPSNANQFVSDAFGGKRQTNGYDCGIYLLAFAEKILQSTQSGDINNVQPEDAKQMRGDLLQLIHRLSSDPKYKPKSRWSLIGDSKSRTQREIHIRIITTHLATLISLSQ